MSTTTNGAADDTVKAAFDPGKTVPLWLDGKEITTESTFDVTSPNDGKVCWKVASASEEDVQRAIESAEKAFKTWSKTKPTYRRDILLKAVEIMRKKTEYSKLYAYTETGQPDAMFGFEHNLGIEGTLTMAGLLSTIHGQVIETSEEGKSAMMIQEPYGVVLAIAPWNACHVLGLRSIIAPLAMGNTCVLKPSELSPATYWNFVSSLQEAGLPAGVLNTIYAEPTNASKITTALVSHPAIRKVNFTGSTNVGSIIASLCGKYLKPCLMELGGKAPSIVCADADLDNAALQCALGAFLYSGQICMSTERIIVEQPVAETFQQKLSATLDQVFSKSAPALTLISGTPVSKNQKLLQDAISKGAHAIYGDSKASEKLNTQMRPVVITNITKEMDIYHTESFGPTVSLYVLDAENFEEKALELANDTDYGLAAAVFTEDLRKGLRLAKGIETGAVHINSMSVHDEAGLPHGGAKKSGFGRFNGQVGLSEWTRSKVITWKD